MGFLTDLGVDVPVLAAPMAGGPTTPSLVTAAASAGSVGFVAAGYLSAAALADQIAAIRTSAATIGVNLFAPNPLPVDAAEFRAYAARLQPEADVYGLDLSAVSPVEDDDDWHAKIDLLLADPVHLVSFTFGIPSRTEIAALQRAGSRVVQTVTSASEALQAADSGVDALVVQASAAGGHSGTLTPRVIPAEVTLTDLVRSVRAAVPLPIIGGGGVRTSTDVVDVISAGAEAVVVGTVLLRSPEAGTSAPFRAALADPARTETVVTRAFTGRPARGLRNGFTDRYTEGAPSGYPALHHLTRPIRRAAAEAGDAERINLWAGTGWRHASTDSAATILRGLTADL